jgi:cobalt-precorrin-5B (C1)-methyltransferase
MDEDDFELVKPSIPLRRGWTTGACATAATRAALEGLWTTSFPASATITLPSGTEVSFAVATSDLNRGSATAGIIKDAGDDPDVTHGALVLSTVSAGPLGSGVTFKAGPGVGMVTRPGLPIPPGEPAINPVPREMIRLAVATAAREFGRPGDIVVELSIPGGEALALQTLNGRLGIVGGLSILGTTGVVIPFSCAAWINSIHRGIDVAKAIGLTHVAGSTGSTSEIAIAKLYGLPETALLDMGDFAGGMLKYLKTHPVARVTIAGGFAKMSKLAQGRLDLHSGRGIIDLAAVADMMAEAGADASVIATAQGANTAQQILDLSRAHRLPLAAITAERALATAKTTLAGTGIEVDVVIFDREGGLAGRSRVEVA